MVGAPDPQQKMSTESPDYQVCDEITYPLPNINSAVLEVWERKHNFIPHFPGDVIIDPCWD